MQTTYATPFAVTIPPDARAHGFYASPYLADAFAINLPPDVVASPEQLARQHQVEREFQPRIEATRRKALLAGWRRAVSATLAFAGN